MADPIPNGVVRRRMAEILGERDTAAERVIETWFAYPGNGSLTLVAQYARMDRSKGLSEFKLAHPRWQITLHRDGSTVHYDSLDVVPESERHKVWNAVARYILDVGDNNPGQVMTYEGKDYRIDVRQANLQATRNGRRRDGHFVHY